MFSDECENVNRSFSLSRIFLKWFITGWNQGWMIRFRWNSFEGGFFNEAKQSETHSAICIIFIKKEVHEKLKWKTKLHSCSWQQQKKCSQIIIISMISFLFYVSSPVLVIIILSADNNLKWENNLRKKMHQAKRRKKMFILDVVDEWKVFPENFFYRFSCSAQNDGAIIIRTVLRRKKRERIIVWWPM